jgi:hypothetical protein
VKIDRLLQTFWRRIAIFGQFRTKTVKFTTDPSGSVDLMGHHPSLTPRGASITPDPLVVFSIDDAFVGAEEPEEGDDDSAYVLIAPDEIQKAGESGGEPYQIAVPNETLDGELINERHQILFIEYLRMAFRFGGFPGYEGYDRDVPKEIKELREGLLEF